MKNKFTAVDLRVKGPLTGSKYPGLQLFQLSMRIESETARRETLDNSSPYDKGKNKSL